MNLKLQKLQLIQLAKVTMTTQIIWYEERRKRITASNVGKIAKRRSTTKVSPTVQLFLNVKFQGNSANQMGTFHEEDSNRECLKRKRELSPNISTSKCGLEVPVANPWLGASPAGLVHDPTSDPPDGLVEFKNPYTARNITLDEAVTK